YMLIYATSTALSLPGGAALSITGGFLFGGLAGGLYVVIGATVGATLVFLAARTVLGDSLRSRAGPWFERMEAGFQANAFSYLLTLRLIPLFPFFVVNLVPAFLGVPLRTYMLATAIGIVPGALVFTFTGAGFGSVLDSGEGFSVSTVFTPEVIGALTGLGLLSLLPIIYRRWRAHAYSPRNRG
ncbi:MAG TPA: VTT domain-containing protein, partial [Gammaproteobacteria bacterium]|nr:VTT domain-containing protein [Gammaproteobacteria bacterium]